MMNRMMFIYFIQKKGFLDSDVEYLRTRLSLIRERRGSDKFQTFYRYFLLRLFHEGLGGSERNPELEKLLGKVPYLNGGFFEVHELERRYPEIDIPDKAFEKLFDFFDEWEWTLDDRPLRKGNEINPDVVGYIFEKYINQKQMGAYYSKEDITEYISKNTVLPYLFDVAKKECAVALRSDGVLWRLLQADPNRYIYEPLRRGVRRMTTERPIAVVRNYLAETAVKTVRRDHTRLARSTRDGEGGSATLRAQTCISSGSGKWGRYLCGCVDRPRSGRRTRGFRHRFYPILNYCDRRLKLSTADKRKGAHEQSRAHTRLWRQCLGAERSGLNRAIRHQRSLDNDIAIGDWVNASGAAGGRGLYQAEREGQRLRVPADRSRCDAAVRFIRKWFRYNGSGTKSSGSSPFGKEITRTTCHRLNVQRYQRITDNQLQRRELSCRYMVSGHSR
jgi:hypothetical protein